MLLMLLYLHCNLYSDYPDGDASTNPDSSSVHDDEQFSFEEPLAAGQQSELLITIGQIDLS